VKIRDKVSETSDALTKLREARSQLEAREKAATTPQPDIAAPKAKLLAIETELTRIILSHPLEVTPKGLINKFGTLSGTVAAVIRGRPHSSTNRSATCRPASPYRCALLQDLLAKRQDLASTCLQDK
jgi:hypothetical protein